MQSTTRNVLKGSLRCRPTRYGWIFIVVLLAMLAGSINYNNNLGFLFTFLLGSMAAVSLIHSYRNLAGVTVESTRTWPVFAQQPAVFHFYLQEGKRRHIALRFRLPGGEDAMVDLSPATKRRVALAIPSTRRGMINPERLSIETAYPFGLFRFRVAFTANMACLVYPKPIPVQHLTAQDLLRAHAAEGDAPESADDFKGLRSYQDGDPIQHIFWKAYSRGRGLMIKEFAGAEAPALFFSWDKIKAEDKEKKLSVLCAMILKAHGLKADYGLKLPGKTISPDRDEHHKNRCLRALALY